jgi:hypothetical protein
LYSSPNIIKVNKSRRMRWKEYVANRGNEKHNKLWSGNLKRRDYMPDLGVDGRIIYYILQRCDETAWTKFMCLRIRYNNGVIFEHAKEPLGPRGPQSRALLGQLSN